MRKTLLALIVILAIATASVGGTLADFSDIETSQDNYIKTGSLDLKVATADENWVAGVFHDDPMLDMVMEIDDGEICQTYGTNLLLKNVGSGAGWAYLFFHLTEDSASIADTTTLSIWYDTDGDLTLELITEGTLGSLDLTPILLAELPDGETHRLRLEIHPTTAPDQVITSFRLAFNVAFWLPQLLSYSDIENTDGYLEGVVYQGCTPGFWGGTDTSNNWGPTLWDEANDPDWTVAGGSGTNPYIHTTLFNDFFTSHPDLDGLTMMNLVGTGGGPNPVRKAARDLVAAYLNASFGMNYPLDTTELHNLWDAAVTTGVPTFSDLHNMLDIYNNLGSPF